MRRLGVFSRSAPVAPKQQLTGATALMPSMLTAAWTLTSQRREIFADKIRAGTVLYLDKRYWRVAANTRAQKGQSAASFNLKMVEIGNNTRKKDLTTNPGADFNEAKYERLKLLFSGFDDDDQACFVYPETSNDPGKEVNIPGSSLPQIQQDFLCCGMPVDILHIVSEEEDENGNAKDIYAEINMPTNYTYTVEKFSLKGSFKMAELVECDGKVSVTDNVQVGNKIKVVIRPDGTATFGGRVTE